MAQQCDNHCDADYSYCRLHQNVMIKVTVYKSPGHDETCKTFSRYIPEAIILRIRRASIESATFSK